MKGILLCADNMLRLAPVIYTMPKELIPVANTPILEYTIKRLVESGINNIAMVVGENRKMLENHFLDGRAFNCRIKYYYQPKQIGSAYSLLCAKDFADDDFLLIMGNTYFDFELHEYIKKFKVNKSDVMLMLKKVGNPLDYEGAVIENEKISKVVEKYRASKNSSAIAGIYFCSPVVLKAASRIKPSYKGEYTLANTLQYLLDREYRINYMDVLPFCMDINRHSDILECNKYMLSKSKEKSIISQDSRIINSRIGDFVSIGSRCIIKDAHINNSIIMDDCIINGVEIYDSIICKYSTAAGKGSLNGLFSEKTKIYVNNDLNEQNSGTEE